MTSPTAQTDFDNNAYLAWAEVCPEGREYLCGGMFAWHPTLGAQLAKHHLPQCSVGRDAE